MPLNRHDDGKWYGTMEVLLTRVVEDEDGGAHTEALHGTRAPFGYVLVSEFEGKHYVEKPDSFWTGHGFTITEPPILEEARRISREKSHERR